MNKKVRVRFAPSPTGGLHIGGVRTVLYNYLFARHHGGDFILRIEDTDQTRFVPGAEEYIYETLSWCGLEPDESPKLGGNFGPYRQSERKEIYRKYAEQLVSEGKAYYAFDTAEELDAKRKSIANFQYNISSRIEMKNSLALNENDVKKLLDENVPYVIRIKMPANEEVKFSDMIRGEVAFNTSQVDDKVLLKADGMPTYHLAVVADDYLMQITHAFRGEEWLPSAPVHILLWRYLFGEENMPQWAHLPLILKPDGNGKLSKRDGEKLGFPVFAMDWVDPKTNEITSGFKERGFLPEAVINMLALLGWNDGTEQEIFSLKELIEKFSMDRVHKSGAKFNYEKAKWFNHEWIKKSMVNGQWLMVKKIMQDAGIQISDHKKLKQVIELVKDRCTFLTDFVLQSSFFFKSPETIDITAIKPKWDEKKNLFFIELIRSYELMNQWQHDDLEKEFKEIAAANEIKPGDVLLPFRIMLVGGKFGPGVFDIAAILGKEETIIRIKKVLALLQPQKINLNDSLNELIFLSNNLFPTLKYYNDKHPQYTELFLIGLIERLFQSVTSLKTLLSEFEKNTFIDFSIGIVFRSLLLDSLIALNLYKIFIENFNDKKEDVLSKLNTFSIARLSDGLKEAIDHYYLMSPNDKNDNKKNVVMTNLVAAHKEFFEPYTNLNEKPRLKSTMKKEYSQDLFKNLINDPILKPWSYIYDLYAFYSKYDHYGVLYFEIIRVSREIKESNFHFMVKNLLSYAVILHQILSYLNESDEFLKNQLNKLNTFKEDSHSQS